MWPAEDLRRAVRRARGNPHPYPNPDLTGTLTRTRTRARTRTMALALNLILSLSLSLTHQSAPNANRSRACARAPCCTSWATPPAWSSRCRLAPRSASCGARGTAVALALAAPSAGSTSSHAGKPHSRTAAQPHSRAAAQPHSRTAEPRHARGWGAPGEVGAGHRACYFLA